MSPRAELQSNRYVVRLSVAVHAPDAPSPAICRLAPWMAEQPGVMDVVHDCPRGRMDIHYDMRKSAACLLRSLVLDKIAACEPPRPVSVEQPEEGDSRLEVTVAHELPGRVRLRVGPQGLGHSEQVAARLATLPGVVSARALRAGGSVVVTFTPSALSVGSMLETLRTNLRARLPEPSPGQGSSRRQLVKLGCTAAVFGAVMTGIVPAPIAVVAVGITAFPSYNRALQVLRERRVNVDVMDATAITICLIQLNPIAAGAITTLLSLGDVILDRTQDRARNAISKLMQLDDFDAFILDHPGSPPRRASPRDLESGMRIVIYPGARIPADGVLVSGAITVDEKAITGESLPRERLVGEEVLAASVAVEGQAIVEITRAGSDTTAAHILQILANAGMKPMTLQRNAERRADRLVLPTFAVGAAAYVFSGALDRLASVLITDFGTGVRIAVPTTALTSMTLAARRGILMKGSQYIERFNEIDTIIFDKTGTLTRGVPAVTDTIRLGELSEQDIIALAAAAEANQSHPLANAICTHAEAQGIPVLQVEQGSESYRIGLGLAARVDGRRVCIGNARLMRELGVDIRSAERAQEALAQRGTSSVVVAVDDELAGVIGFADSPREESGEVIRKLRDGGRRKILLLSGDARAPVEAIARHCGIDEAIAEVLPHEKAEVVKSLKAAGRKVAMVGDGINDAPALALADVGISLHGATDVARETADVVLLEGGLARLPEAFTLSSSAMKRVHGGLVIVLVPNAMAIAMGALGLINPVMAAVINNGSTVAAALYAAFPLLSSKSLRAPQPPERPR